MLITLKKKMIQAFILMTFILVLGCSTTEKESEVLKPDEIAAKYEGWNRYEYKNLVFHYDSNYLFKDSMYSYAKKYITMIRKQCQFLELPIPNDTLDIFHYSGYGQGRSMSGEKFPSAQGDTIHFWSGNHFGTPTMRYLVDRWSKIETRHKFLYHGILKVLDASGRDHHARTFLYIDSNMFIPLKELAVDEKVNADIEWMQSAEAASFVDFIVFKYGAKNLRILYESPTSFDSTVLALMRISVDSLEANWLDVVGRATGRIK